MTFTTQAAAQQRAANEQFEQDCRVGLDAIYQSYPTLARSIATDKEIIRLCSEFMGATVAPNKAVFEMMLAENPDCGLPVKSVEAQCEELVEEICSLLRSADGTGRDGKYSDQNLATYRKNTLRFMSKESLQQRLAGIKEAQRLQKLTPAAIRAEERAKRVTYIATHLPPEITAEELKENINLLKFWIRAKGVNAVNDRLFGRG